MKTMFIMVGIPGSGKSTLAKRLSLSGSSVVKVGLPIYSADLIRKRLYGDENIQGDGKKVYTDLYTDLHIACLSGKDIIVDNTNCKKGYRDQLCSIAKQYGYDTIFIVMNTDLDVALARNKQRERQVPEDVIRAMDKNLRNGSLF